VRPIKLEFFDHPFTCPLCSTEIVYTSMEIVIVYSRRLCPSCKGELVIQQGKIITAAGDRKPPKRESVASGKRSRR
jgi:competence CoiA-like predicted nuclease